MLEVVPQPRIDVLVDDAATGERRRRTTYSGTVWYGGRMNLGLGGGSTMNAYTRARIASPFFLPDSLPYDPAQAADVQLSVVVGLQGAGEGQLGVIAGAALVADPQGQPPWWVQVGLQGNGRVPAIFSYLVEALSPPDVVLPPPGD